MKIILYSWSANNEQILAKNLTEMGHEVIWYSKKCNHFTRDMELAGDMITFIHSQKADAVISFNYFPIISMICDVTEIPYYSWVYDCPHFTLLSKNIDLMCNHVGIFDEDMDLMLRGYGTVQTMYVPLAVDTRAFGNALAKKGRYSCDVSFVGSLYTDEYNYYDKFVLENTADTSSKEWIDFDYWDDLVEKQAFNYRKDCLGRSINNYGKSNPFYLALEREGLLLGEDYFAHWEDIFRGAVLEKKVTVIERRRLFEEIADKLVNKNSGDGISFNIFSASDFSLLPKLKPFVRGTVSYDTEMPCVFADSKINLNVTLRSIHSGIPLRVLDIMACGGFVLTNYQPAIDEMLKNGGEIVMFDSVEEAIEKIEYYLAHDDERKAIAEAGKKAVEEKFNYKTMLPYLLD